MGPSVTLETAVGPSVDRVPSRAETDATSSCAGAGDPAYSTYNLTRRVKSRNLPHEPISRDGRPICRVATLVNRRFGDYWHGYMTSKHC